MLSVTLPLPSSTLLSKVPFSLTFSWWLLFSHVCPETIEPFSSYTSLSFSLSLKFFAHESPSGAFFLVKYHHDEINSWLINFFQDKDSDSDSGEDPEKKKVWSIFNPFWMARNLSYPTKRKKKNKHFGFHVTLARSWSILEPLRDGHLPIASKFPSWRSYWGRGLS